MKTLTLAKIMSSKVDTISPMATIRTALAIMVENQRSCLVMTGTDKKPVGILSERGLLKRIALAEDVDELYGLPCIEVVQPLISAESTLSVDEAIHILKLKRNKHLVVVNDDNSLAGLVTHSELVNSYAEVVVHSREHLERRVAERTQELESANRKLATMSLVDPLTGLSNRRSLQVDVMKTHASSIRHGHTYSIALLDIDYFKRFNDHYGHQAGDDALQAVAEQLKLCIRETDYLYRYGGEEFLILMPETNSQEARIPLQRVMNAFEKLAMPHEKSPFGRITMSAGASCSNHQLAGWREIIELADRRLYDAKSNGRNQYSVKDPGTLRAVQTG